MAESRQESRSNINRNWNSSREALQQTTNPPETALTAIGAVLNCNLMAALDEFCSHVRRSCKANESIRGSII